MNREDIEILTLEAKAQIVKGWIGDIVIHFKGDNYLVLDIARHHEDNEYFIVYKALYEGCTVYTRPLTEVFDWVQDRLDNIAGNKIRFEPICVTAVKERGVNNEN